MKLFTSTALQGATWIAGFGATYGGFVPPPYNFAVLGASTIASLFLHRFAGVHDTKGNLLPKVVKEKGE